MRLEERKARRQPNRAVKVGGAGVNKGKGDQITAHINPFDRPNITVDAGWMRAPASVLRCSAVLF
jgi:hypothetical protein